MCKEAEAVAELCAEALPGQRLAFVYEASRQIAAIAAAALWRRRSEGSGFIERLAERLGVTAKATNIYGAPVERNGITVIPVAKVMYGLGGGSGSKAGEEGAGGGGGVAVTPMGFIEITDEKARFRSIRDPLVILPIIAATSLMTVWALRGIYRLVRR